MNRVKAAIQVSYPVSIVVLLFLLWFVLNKWLMMTKRERGYRNEDEKRDEREEDSGDDRDEYECMKRSFTRTDSRTKQATDNQGRAGRRGNQRRRETRERKEQREDKFGCERKERKTRVNYAILCFESSLRRANEFLFQATKCLTHSFVETSEEQIERRTRGRLRRGKTTHRSLTGRIAHLSGSVFCVYV